MPTRTYAGVEVAVDEQGFFLDPSRWDEAMAPEIAAAEGVPELTDRHWQVVKFMRHEYEEKGTGPSVRAPGKTSGVPIKDQGALRLVPRRTGEARCEDRRDPQATRLHLSPGEERPCPTASPRCPS